MFTTRELKVKIVPYDLVISVRKDLSEMGRARNYEKRFLIVNIQFS
jgi:hypothetical protein